MRDINGKSVALLGRRPPHFSTGVYTQPSKLQSFCSQCGKAEDTVIRCETSFVTLCHTCKRIFKNPDGTEITVSPAELYRLENEYDTWKAFTVIQRGGEQ